MCPINLRTLAIYQIFVLVAVVLPAVEIQPALASPLSEKQAELAASQARLEDIQAEIDQLTETWARTEDEIRAAEASIKRAEADEVAAELELERKRAVLAERLSNYYKQTHGSYPMAVQVFMGSTSLTEALNQIPLLVDIVEQDKDLLEQVAALNAALTIKQEELARQQAALTAKLSALAITKTELDRLLQEAAKERERLQHEADVLAHADQLVRQAEAARSGWRGRVSARTLTRARGFAFPVDGPHSFIHDWGFPRPDDRVHKGTDIMARRGTPVVAVRDGTISRVAYHQPLGGTVIWLRADNGTSYYYAHLAEVASDIHTGTRVVAGYPIGKVGDTGNARGGDPHLHFGMYPGGGAAADPYLLLKISD